LPAASLCSNYSRRTFREGKYMRDNKENPSGGPPVGSKPVKPPLFTRDSAIDRPGMPGWLSGNSVESWEPRILAASSPPAPSGNSPEASTRVGPKTWQWCLIVFAVLSAVGMIAGKGSVDDGDSGNGSNYSDCADFLSLPVDQEPATSRMCVGDDGGTTTWGNYREDFFWNEVEGR
jgi:hypothetical protein